MSTLLDRIADRDGRPSVASDGTPLVDIESRIHQGSTLDALGLDPLDALAALAFLGLGPAGSDGPTLRRRTPPRPRLAAAVTEAGLARLWPGAPRPRLLALAAGLLLVHDAWDASHEAAQEAEDRGDHLHAPYWHGIAHRREPDAGNAAYWFRRVGRHPVLDALGRSARPLLDAHGDRTLADRLLRGGSWDPFAFIDLCIGARPGSPEAALAGRLQRAEMAALLDATADGLA